MEGGKPGKVPTDPEAYKAFLKRWGLDDQSLGISELRGDAAAGSSRRPSNPPNDAAPESSADAGSAAPDADEPPAVPQESEESSDGPSTAQEPPIDAEPVSTDATPKATGDDGLGEADPADDIGLTFLDEEPEALIVSSSERKRRRVWLRRGLLALGVVIALILGTAGFYLVVGLQALQSIRRDPGLLPTDDAYQTVPPRESGPLNFVLMGSDSRNSNDPGRSDSLMVAHLDASRSTLYLITVPRDLYVDIPGHGKNKVNAAYAFGGAALTVKTVQQLTDARMDHTILIDFDGFIGLTSDIGGVTVFNEIPSTNLGFTWPRGNITISGEEALAYVRQRYDLPRGDFDRAARQRDVVKAIILKLMKPEVMANPATFNAVASKLGHYVRVDTRLTNEAIWALASSLGLHNARDIRQIQVPISRDDQINGASVQILNTERMALLKEALATDSLGGYWNQYGED